MKLLNFFKKKEVGQIEQNQNWNQIWNLWEQGNAASPYAELMTYQSDVGNGGHDQYFLNTENCGDLQAELAVLESILPEKHRCNLKKAYSAYLALAQDEDDAQAETILEQCDELFYEREGEIRKILEQYAAELTE